MDCASAANCVCCSSVQAKTELVGHVEYDGFLGQRVHHHFAQRAVHAVGHHVDAHLGVLVGGVFIKFLRLGKRHLAAVERGDDLLAVVGIHLRLQIGHLGLQFGNARVLVRLAQGRFFGGLFHSGLFHGCFFGGDGLGGFLGQRRDGGEHQRAQQGAEYTLQGHGMFLLVVAAPARADAIGSDYSTKRRRIQCFNAQVHGLFTLCADDTQKTHLCPARAFDMAGRWCIM